MPDSAAPQPAVILGSGGVMTNSAQLIRLKVHASGTEFVADASALFPALRPHGFAVGDTVRRALWSPAGAEEIATVTGAAQPDGTVPIRVWGGKEYATDPLRLRASPPVSGGVDETMKAVMMKAVIQAKCVLGFVAAQSAGEFVE